MSVLFDALGVAGDVAVGALEKAGIKDASVKVQEQALGFFCRCR